MKTQMRFQKIIFRITLIIAAISIVYALSFCTGAIAYIGHWERLSTKEINNVFGSSGTYNDLFYSLLDTWDAAQSYTNILLALGIVFILLVIVCYIFANSSRRNYYKVNYITTIILAVYAVVWAVLAIIFSLQIQTEVLGNDAWMVVAQEYAKTGDPESYRFSSSTWIYIVGYIVALLTIVDACALVYCIIWKYKLMQGEKQLLANGQNVTEVKEVA